MANMDGLDTLRAIRQAHPTAQVIMLSGRHAPATVIEAVRLGAADYVLKPGDAEGLGEAALEAAIRNALQRDALSAEVARLSAQVAEDPEGTQPCWGRSGHAPRVMSMSYRVADSNRESCPRRSGTGKDVIARERIAADDAPSFVKGTAPPAATSLSTCFCHERGPSPLGITRIGKFEFADGGTIMSTKSRNARVLPANFCTSCRYRQSPSWSEPPIDVDVQ